MVGFKVSKSKIDLRRFHCDVEDETKIVTLDFDRLSAWQRKFQVRDFLVQARKKILKFD